MSPRLSIIIPVFNGHDFICRCLDSIYLLPLTMEELEVIVVDDCSQDDTMCILENYRQQRSNLVICHQTKNQRQGAARNIGIDIAKGEYLSFVDADDWIVADGYINALNAVSKSHADICYFELEFKNQHSTNWTLCRMPSETHNTIMSSRDYLNNYYTCYYNGPVRNLYRTEFLRRTGIRFVEGVRWEDCDWTVKVYAEAKEIQFVDGVGYRYAYNESSTSYCISPQAMAERIYAGTRLLAFADDIRSNIPRLSTTLEREGQYGYVTNELRLRNITKYNISFVREMYDFLGDNVNTLRKYKWPRWVGMMIRHKWLSMALLAALCPIAAVGRKSITIYRTKKNDT